MEWWLSLAACIGIVVLAVPVWRLNLDKRMLQRIRDADRPDADGASFRARARRIAEAKQGDKVAGWHWWHEACLWIGYGLVAGSALGRLFLPTG